MLSEAFGEITAHAIVAIAPIQRLTEASTAADPLSGLLQYGVLGLVVIGFATGWIVPGPQAKQLAADNIRLTGVIEGKLFPMFEQYAQTMERAAAALEKSAEAMDRQAQREREAFDLAAMRNDRADRVARDAGNERAQRDFRG